MLPGRIFEHLSPYARVFTAAAPFLVAIVLRMIFGNTKATRTLLSVATVWFAVNVLIAPYSYRMRQDLVNLRHTMFR